MLTKICVFSKLFVIFYIIALPPKTLDDLTKDEFASLLDVNVLGTFLVSKVINLMNQSLKFG